ncbi:unnamed protein product [Microthlaspi erraticum]|uniref:Transposase-associated domain-containing protein n=1 Tax=Microthlaspi erraticum TaxID=1685480 RepID=A0A6D2JGU0_9BRAS|nr:unnamed protein product [Microthlaspi erraticum]
MYVWDQCKGMTMILDLLKEAFAHAKLPQSFSDMKKVIRKLGLTSESIHACPNNCKLYWEANAERETCIVCDESRWKKNNSSANSDGKLGHPRDGLAWKAFDIQHPKFAADPRNVRLGLASDGFNPFGTTSSSYSIWPVVLFPYNLPPWISMKQTSIILSMIIPEK